MSEKMDLLVEELNKEKESKRRVKNTFLENIHIENILALFVLFYIIGGNKDNNILKSVVKNPENMHVQVSKMNHIVRDISPYFEDDVRTSLTGLESVLNVVENIYGIKNGAYKTKAQSMGKISAPKKHIKVLEKIAPHLEGPGRENAVKILELNNRIEDLTGNEKNIIKTGQNVIEILDLLNVKQATEMKNNIAAIKTVMKLLNN